MIYHSDEIPLDIGFSLTGLLPMHCVSCRYYQTCPFLVQSHKSIFKNRRCFSVTSIVLNDVNVRGGNVIRLFAREIGASRKFVSL